MENINIQEIGKKVETAFMEVERSKKQGKGGNEMFHSGVALGILEMVEMMYGVEQRDHMEKLAKSKVQEAKVRGYLYK
ncbi:MAG: hypothetical protein BWX78_01826 [Firmicutes bacterium ADurb.Bin099]|jgi:hypothetical protein|nr:MAG: hypothetical protein BWX78_01846 [Firmicutes bacterium ADurb.Bin099]OQB99175.1 MAG: hypothetical protein BWX78_01826 [Firmicutes bacterium ADurb.Bin099]